MCAESNLEHVYLLLV